MACRRLKLIEKFIIYGCFGWAVEIFFTSMAAQMDGTGTISLQGHSYIWMLLVWGLGFLLMEKLYRFLINNGIMLLVRAAIYMVACISWEYVFGMTFSFLLDKIPWDYSYSEWSVGGATRLDYAPYWFVGGILMEIFLKMLDRVRIKVGSCNEKNTG